MYRASAWLAWQSVGSVSGFLDGFVDETSSIKSVNGFAALDHAAVQFDASDDDFSVTCVRHSHRQIGCWRSIIKQVESGGEKSTVVNHNSF